MKSIAVTQAARSSRVGDLVINKKQPIGFIDGDLVAVGETVIDVMGKVLDKVDLTSAEVITIYYQGSPERVEIEKFIISLRKKHPHIQLELVKCGQPHYNYIASVE